MARTPNSSQNSSNSSTRCLSLGDNSAGSGLLLTTLALLALGVVVVHSAMIRPVIKDVDWFSRVANRHTIYAAIAAIVLFTMWRLDYHRLDGKRFPTTAGLILLISLVLAGVVQIPGIGHKEGEYARWLKLGPISFQPSELLKFTLVIFLATWLGRPGTNVRSFWKTFIPAMVIIGIGVGAVVTEDVSTGAVVGLVAIVTLLLAGVPWYYMLLLIPPVLAGAYKFVLTDPYRFNRVKAWLDPFGDAAENYQPRESLLAILSGGWSGKGLGAGTVKLGYLPEGSTDFVFSVFAEEWGFIGAVLLMSLFILWMWHARKAAARAGDRFGRLLVGSLGFLLAIQAVMHIAVALVTAPTTGMGLPFISYGGTALVISAGAVALMVSVSARGMGNSKDNGELAGPAIGSDK
jgi:cell division protein FtsW